MRKVPLAHANPTRELRHRDDHGETEIGAEILLRISREFGKSIEWLLTGEEQKSTREGN